MEKFLIDTNDNIPFYKRKIFFLISGITIIIILIIIIIVAASNSSKDNKKYIPFMCLDEKKKPSKNCIGGWFYKIGTYTPEYNAKFAKYKNWNYVLMTTDITSSKTAKNIREFRKLNISVHLMTLENPKYLDNPESVYDIIKNIIIFVKNNSLDIQGIHIDVEPHAKDEWKNGDSPIRTKIFKNYTKILENCRKAINDYMPNLTFSAAVAWFYSSKTKKNEIIGGRGYELVDKKRLDFIVPMVYSGAGGSLENIMKHTEDYIEDKANTVIGIAVRDYNETLNDMINKIYENRKNSSYFCGISIFANHYYSDWGKEIN